MTKEELQKECESLRFENRRLLSYIAACRMRFGDSDVNRAISELVPRTEPKATPLDWRKAAEEFAKKMQPTTPQ